MPPSPPRLCSLCESIDLVVAIQGQKAYETRTIPHQQSYADLLKTATTCQLCAVFQASLFREGRPPPEKSQSLPVEHLRKSSSGIIPDFIRRSSTPKSFLTKTTVTESDITRTDSGNGVVEDVVGWHEELDRRGDAFLIEIKAESTLDADFAVEYVVRYQRPLTGESLMEGPKPRPIVLSNEVDLGLGIVNRPITPAPSFNIYSNWIKECAYGGKHLRCMRADEVDLPARLVDVGTGSGSNVPKLVTTKGMKGQYLTLSHCWGKHRILVTTTKNIKTHQEGISFSHFPRLFRDAMLITRILGFRYIWIDTMCIVQDDVSDWERECARMGDIYLNSVCTLAAPSAQDSQTGLLEHRHASDMPSCRLSNGLTIGPPPSELKEHASVLSSRAWVLQEQILSPRTLCFGRNGMYFQCNSHEQLESYHHALPPERVTSWRTSQAADLPKTLITLAAADAFYWYAICRQYSFRRLTYGDDKLPAISGLANYIAGELEEDDDICELGEYWAGLWSEDLARGLLWTSDSSWDKSKTLHSVDKCIPTWSWASQNTPVEWKVLRDFRADFECVQAVVERTSEHQFGRVSNGRLELNAPVKTACLQRYGGSLSIRGVVDIREIAELTLDNTAEAFFAATWPAIDASFTCRLLMLGQAVSSLYGQRWYALVLVPMGHAQYRRVGMANSLGRGVEHARSLTGDHSWNWFGDAAVESVVLV